MSAPPLISVIIPFGDPRGRPEHLASWTRDQTLPAEQFELIVVTPDLKPKRDAAIRSYLRPQDSLMTCDRAGAFACYAAGVKAARGSYLFFSEDHCLADPECLEAAARFMEDPAYVGASVRWRGINHTGVAKMEDLLAEHDSRQWSLPGHWNKLRIRGFILLRDAYDQVGGLKPAYGAFAEALLAAELHAKGYTIGSIAEAGVRHVNTYYLSEIFDNIWSYAWGESAYCDTHERNFCERYFAASTNLPSDPVVMKLRDVELGRAGMLHRVRRTRRWAQLMVLGARIRFACWRYHPERRFAAFRDFQVRVMELAQATYRTHVLKRQTSVPTASNEVKSIRIAHFSAKDRHAA